MSKLSLLDHFLTADQSDCVSKIGLWNHMLPFKIIPNTGRSYFDEITE